MHAGWSIASRSELLDSAHAAESCTPHTPLHQVSRNSFGVLVVKIIAKGADANPTYIAPHLARFDVDRCMR